MLAFPVLSYTPHLPSEILWSSEQSPTLYGCHKAGSQQATHSSTMQVQLFSKEHCYTSLGMDGGHSHVCLHLL